MKTSEQKRDSIRTAAFRCFRDNGYHESTIDDICAAAGISKGSFYWYFSSKQEVFADILQTWSREVVDELHLQFEDALRQGEYVTSITQAVTRETHRGRAIIPLWLEFGVHARRDPEIQVAISQFYRRVRSAITEILRPALGDRLTDSELEAVSATIFGAYSGLLIQDLCDPQGAEVRDTVRRFMLALGALLAREPRAVGVVITSPTGEAAGGADRSNATPDVTIRDEGEDDAQG